MTEHSKPEPCAPPDPSVSGRWLLQSGGGKPEEWEWLPDDQVWHSDDRDGYSLSPSSMAFCGFRVIGPAMPFAELKFVACEVDRTIRIWREKITEIDRAFWASVNAGLSETQRAAEIRKHDDLRENASLERNLSIAEIQKAFAARLWLPIADAPKDEHLPYHDRTVVLLYAPPRDGLPAMQSTCRHHDDAGWYIDELRSPTLYQPLPGPPEDVKP